MHTPTQLLRPLAALALSALAVTACSDEAPSPLAPAAPAGAMAAKGGKNTLPTNGRIYFSSSFTGNGEIFSINPDGSDRRRLTYTSGHEFEIAVSRDGSKLAYLVETPGVGIDLYTMNVDGSGVRRLTTLNSSFRHPSWSPDGRTIAVQHGAPGTYTGIWTVPAKGGKMTRLTPDGTLAFAPAWSPDGGRIVYLTFNASAPLNADLMIMNADGSEPTLLRDCSDATCNWPAWSPDGAWLVFTWGSGASAIQRLCRMDVEGDACNWSANVQGDRAVFSPDGSRYLVEGSTVVGEGQKLLTADRNGAALIAVTENVFSVGGIAWGR